jgi:hypothetical protein
MERQETSRLLGNLPWRRLEADRKVTPHGQVLPRRNYGYGLTAKTSLRSECVHHCKCPIFHAAAGRRGQKRRTQSALTRCASLHVSRFPDGSDAVRKDTRAVTAISGAPFLWLDGCRQLLIRYGKQGMQSKKHFEQALQSGDRSPTHEVPEHDCHIPPTTPCS